MPTAQTITLEDLLANRASTYGFLSRLFKVEVDEEFLSYLRSMKVPTHTGSAAVDDGYRQIRDYLAQADTGVITELAVDYVRTFIGGGNNGYSAAYPFESVYTSPKRLLMQGARDEVLVIYRAAGLEKSESWGDGEDHIALELEFMEVLGKRALEAVKAGNEEEACGLLLQSYHFLNEHVLAWFPMMEADMHKFAKTGFYQGVASLTAGFLETDREMLCDLLDIEDEAPATDVPAVVVEDLV